MCSNDHCGKPNPLEVLQALLRRRHSPHVIASARERVLDPAPPEWIGFHDEDEHWFWALLIARHWIHSSPNLCKGRGLILPDPKALSSRTEISPTLNYWRMRSCP
jgi:hypothetical protein